MNKRRSEADSILDIKALDSQNIELAKNVTTLQEQNERLRAENEKVKQHSKELYDSIKITRAKTIEKTSSLLTKNEKLKAQLKGKMTCVTMKSIKPKVLAPGVYAVDVEPIPPRTRNNREVHLDYLKHLKEISGIVRIYGWHLSERIQSSDRPESINGKRYILVIIDDYSRFTWVKFLRSNDETPEFVIKFLKKIQVGLNKTVRFIRTDNGIEFVNKVLTEFYESVSITHQKSVPRTPQQNGVVERQNHTRVEAARTMLIFSMGRICCNCNTPKLGRSGIRISGACHFIDQ
ncbi:integrase, catalytic region, zinc finger, CCHC-type containing protein [Tanacetum coccineum]